MTPFSPAQSALIQTVSNARQTKLHVKSVLPQALNTSSSKVNAWPSPAKNTDALSVDCQAAYPAHQGLRPVVLGAMLYVAHTVYLAHLAITAIIASLGIIKIMMGLVRSVVTGVHCVTINITARDANLDIT